MAEKAIQVAVISPYMKDFLQYVKETAGEGEEYIWVYSLDKVQGRRFHRIEKLRKYYEIKDIHEIMEYLEAHKKII